MLSTPDALLRKTRLVDDRATERRAVRQKLIEDQDSVIQDLRADLHAAAGIWPISPSDPVIAQVRRQLATSTGFTRRAQLQDQLLKLQMVSIRLFRGRLSRPPSRSATLVQKHARAAAWARHFAR